MKSVSFFIDNNTITFTNDWAGNETVILNDTVVSEKFSWFGTSHVFTLKLNGVLETITIKSGISFRHGITVKLYKADNLIEKQYLGLCMGNSETARNTYLIIGAVYIILSFTMLGYAFLPIGFVFLILGLNSNSKAKASCRTKRDAN